MEALAPETDLDAGVPPFQRAALHGTEASFGTIAPTVDDRLAFWAMVAELE